jgi:hypothetical protein
MCAKINEIFDFKYEDVVVELLSLKISWNLEATFKCRKFRVYGGKYIKDYISHHMEQFFYRVFYKTFLIHTLRVEQLYYNININTLYRTVLPVDSKCLRVEETRNRVKSARIFVFSITCMRVKSTRTVAHKTNHAANRHANFYCVYFCFRKIHHGLFAKVSQEGHFQCF